MDTIIERYNDEIGNDPNALAIIKGRFLDQEFDKKAVSNFSQQLDKLFQEYAEKETV